MKEILRRDGGKESADGHKQLPSVDDFEHENERDAVSKLADAST
jgi:hypothetical protein